MTAPNAAPPEFSAAAVEQLGGALRSYLASHDDVSRDRLRVALERMCAEAHAAKLGPERLLVAVKAAWAGMPGVERADVERARILLEGLVGYCIEAYYGHPDGSRSRLVEQRQESRVV